MDEDHLPPYRHVVVATDFSRQAQAAAARATWLPLAPQAHIHLVHALPEARRPVVRPELVADVEARLAALARQLGKALATRDRADVQVSARWLRGRPAETLTQEAATQEADLLVLGRRGLGRVRGLLLGSTTARIAAMAPCDVLIVQRPANSPWRHAMVAVDLGPYSAAVLAAARRALGDGGPAVPVVHAWRSPWELEGWDGFSEGLAPPILALPDDARSEAVAALQDLVEHTGAGWQAELRHGDARHVLRTCARDQAADLVVVGAHGPDLPRHLLGSVADAVVRSVQADVLIVRPPVA